MRFTACTHGGVHRGPAAAVDGLHHFVSCQATVAAKRAEADSEHGCHEPRCLHLPRLG